MCLSVSCTRVPYGSRHRALGQQVGFCFYLYAFMIPQHASAISVLSGDVGNLRL